MERILQIWPTVGLLAEDLGLPYQTVMSWKARGVPPRRFQQIIQAAEKRGSVITFEELTRANAALRAA